MKKNIKQATASPIEVNGMATSFNDLGKGKRPIIFVHGFPFDKTSWQPQVDFLSKTHRAIAYDIRGFGASTAGKETAGIQLFADDLLKFMDGLSIEKAIVCGLSMGGYILLNAVPRFPDRFEALILADTQCIADSDEAKAKRKKTIFEIGETGLMPFANGFVKNVFTEKSLKNREKWVEHIHKTILSTSAKTVTATLSALAERAETCALLPKIKIPTLIICGREDRVTPVAQSEILQKGIENSALHILENAAHLSNLEQPEEFNRLLLDFVSGLGKK
jgi:3-oxoadipate enol-lactonase